MSFVAVEERRKAQAGLLLPLRTMQLVAFSQLPALRLDPADNLLPNPSFRRRCYA